MTSHSYLFFLVKSQCGSSRFRLFANFFVCKGSNLINFHNFSLNTNFSFEHDQIFLNLIKYSIFFSDETSHQGQSQTSQESSEVPDVKVEAPEAMAEVNESNDENNTSLGNLTADSTGMLDAPSFPSVGIKVNITSQVRFSLFVALFCKFH